MCCGASTCCPFFFLLPFLTYQIFSFFVPGLFSYEKKYYLKCFQSFFFLYFFSFFFTWSILLPILWSFFTQFEMQTGGIHIELEARILTNLRFILKVFLLSQFFFQIPFLSILYLQNFGKEKHLILSQNRNLVYIGILIICSCFCPPDVFIQVFASICCIFLFEIILFAIFLTRSYEFILTSVPSFRGRASEVKSIEAKKKKIEKLLTLGANSSVG